MKTAIIDIGSNSVRYSVMDENTVLANKKLSSTVLADGLFFSGKLSETAMSRTVSAITSYCEEAKADGAEKIFAFATEAVRAASNGAEFCERVRNACGVEIRVLKGCEEAAVGFLGASAGLKEECAVFDLGGASCEVIRGKNGTVSFSHSFPIGCIRLRDGAGGELQKARELIDKAFSSFSLTAVKSLIGIGGTATSLGAMVACPNKYDPALTHGAKVDAEFLESVIGDFFAGRDMRSKYPCLTFNRASVIGYGALVCLKLLLRTGTDSFTVSERDNIEGYYEFIGRISNKD